MPPRAAAAAKKPKVECLAEYYRDLTAEVRWRRDTEFKILAIHLALVAASFTFVLQAQEKGKAIEILMPIAAAALVIYSCVNTVGKIRAENAHYKRLAAKMKLIWKEWNLNTVPLSVTGQILVTDDDLKFGDGQGYRYAEEMVIASMFAYVCFALAMTAKGLLCWAMTVCCGAH